MTSRVEAERGGRLSSSQNERLGNDERKSHVRSTAGTVIYEMSAGGGALAESLNFFCAMFDEDGGVQTALERDGATQPELDLLKAIAALHDTWFDSAHRHDCPVLRKPTVVAFWHFFWAYFGPLQEETMQQAEAHDAATARLTDGTARMVFSKDHPEIEYVIEVVA